MKPFIDLGGFLIPCYSLMVFAGVLAYVLHILIVLEQVDKVDKSITNRLMILSVFGFGAIVAWAFVFNTLFHSIEKRAFTPGGITWLGGVVGGFPTMIFLIHKFVPRIKGRAMEYFSYLLPGVVLAHGLGRIGCFLGGCCFGGVTDSIFGVVFPAGSHAAHVYPGGPGGGSLPLLPTQLFEAVFEIVLFLVMTVFRKKLRNYNVSIYGIAYGIFRFCMEFLRGDDRGSFFLVTPSQFFSILLIVTAVLLILFEKKILFKKLYEKREALRNTPYTPTLKETNRDLYEKFVLLDKLQKDGLITAEEYEKRKNELMVQI